jgi:hypothetical protein
MPLGTWRELCTCPGAAGFDVGLDQDEMVVIPDRGEHEARGEWEHRARREALDVVRAGSAGMSREQVRDLFVAELQARGAEVPPDVILDGYLRVMTSGYLPAARFVGRSLAGLVKFLDRASRPRAD